MKVIVLGAGVVGVTSAWFLNQAGHDVTVYERESAPALQTSYANAGMIAWSSAVPWAEPGLWRKVLAWQTDPLAPLRIKWGSDAALWRFAWKIIANARPGPYARNWSMLLQIGRYSRDTLRDLREHTQVQYDGRQAGTLYLFRPGVHVRHLDRVASWLADYDIEVSRIDADGCVALEPGLAHARQRPACGMAFPSDETGDCHRFTTSLAELSAARGVGFRYGVAVRQVQVDARRVNGLVTEQGETLEADAYVLAAGSHTARLLAPLGIRLPVYPVKGHSLTVPITDPDAAPRSTLMDETRKVAMTRLGDRLRIAGMAELCGYDLTPNPRAHRVIQQVANDWFPRAADLGAGTWWCGLRPATPTGLPIIGPTQRAGNLYINTGHGTLGWTLSCGSGRLLANMVSGVKPGIDVTGLLPRV